MRFATLIAIGLLFLLSLASSCQADEPDKALHSKCLYPTVKLVQAKAHGCGSGVIVRSTKIADHKYENVVLSCAHVALQGGEFNVHVFRYEDDSTIKETAVLPCYFYGVESNNDLAIGLFLSEEPMPCAQISFSSRYFIGSDVSRIGCGLGDDPRYDIGKISAVKTQMGRHKDLIRTTIHTLPGDSGSPLFDSDRNVIGVMIMIRTFTLHGERQYAFNVSYAVPIAKLKAWSASHHDGLDFVWDAKQELPRMVEYQHKMVREWEILEDD